MAKYIVDTEKKVVSLIDGKVKSGKLIADTDFYGVDEQLREILYCEECAFWGDVLQNPDAVDNPPWAERRYCPYWDKYPLRTDFCSHSARKTRPDNLAAYLKLKENDGKEFRKGEPSES